MARKGERLAYLPEERVDGRRLGRNLHHDPRSRDYPVAALLERKRPGLQTWFRRDVFDQGASSSCVGQATIGMVLSSPNRQRLTAPQKAAADPYATYRLAQTLDPWQGTEPDYFGTSTLAGLKAARALGLIDEYRWCFSLDDVLNTLTTLGPVVVGTNWYESMDEPGSDGRVDVAGEIRGGHAYELVSINADEKTVRAVNSWGTKWGNRGRFELSFDDLGRLLDEEGEAGYAVVPEPVAGAALADTEPDEDEESDKAA